MQPPPHNGMMNMQQPGPQYINQQVKNYYVVLSFIKCYYFSTFSHAHSFPTTSSPKCLTLVYSLMCTLFGSYVRTRRICGNVVGRIHANKSSQQWAIHVRKHRKKMKNKNPQLPHKFTPHEWVNKVMKSVRKIVYNFECGKTFIRFWLVRTGAFIARWCSACWIFYVVDVMHISYNSICNFPILELEYFFPTFGRCVMLIVRFSLKTLTLFRAFFYSIFNSIRCRFLFSLKHIQISFRLFRSVWAWKLN